MKSFCLICLFGLVSIMASAQSEVASTALLYNAPYRHFINPAFEPITEGYLYLPALSHISLYAGNNSLSLSDFIINQNGTSMWTLNPASNVNLMNAFRQNTLINANVNIALLGFGWRTRHGGYLHFNLNERVDAGVTLPKDLFQFVLGGGMTNLEGDNLFKLSSLSAQAQLYTELAVGYSRQQSELWTWGLKVKAIAGHAYMGLRNNEMTLNASPEKWSLNGAGSIRIAAPLKTYPQNLDASTFGNGGYNINENLAFTDVKSYFNGYGAAFDFGVAVKPIKYITISASLTDIGAVYWLNGRQYQYNLDGSFSGMGQINYGDYVGPDGKFDGKQLGDTMLARLKNVYEGALTSQEGKKGFLAPLTMKLNASVEVNLVNDIIGLGVYSKTMWYNYRFYEEVTFGAAVRPTSWFNFGVSYSFLNGKWSNLGAGLGLRLGPFIISVAADYVPITYAAYNGNYWVPYKTQGVNAELGLGIVWGWKQKKESLAEPTIAPKN